MAEHSKQSMDAIKDQLAETRRKLEEAQKVAMTPTAPQPLNQTKSGGDGDTESSMIPNLEEFVQGLEDKANDDGLAFAEHVECRFSVLHF